MGALVLIASYAFDWIVLIAFALAGYGINNITPNKHPFSLEDRTISFPFHDDTISVATVALMSAVAPIVIIFVLTWAFVPGPTVPKGTPKSLIWKRRLWELHASWLGLALSLVSTWFILNGMKNLFGKPRPNLLARCQPDIANVAQYVVGGFLTDTSDGRLVSADICKNPNPDIIDEGFRSFPSGHCSFSAAGLVYLSLFLCTKLGATVPFLHPTKYSKGESDYTAFPTRLHFREHTSSIPLERRNSNVANGAEGKPHRTSVRQQAAAPPIYLMVICSIPALASVYVCASRWYDYQHHGFDILFGFGMGCVTSVIGFSAYHLPLGRGAGWAWGPRSREKAFWAGLGSNSYGRARDQTSLEQPQQEMV